VGSVLRRGRGVCSGGPAALEPPPPPPPPPPASRASAAFSGGFGSAFFGGFGFSDGFSGRAAAGETAVTSTGFGEAGMILTR
jgi:hypothetical protein